MMSWSSMWLLILVAFGEASVEMRRDDSSVTLRSHQRRTLESVVQLGDHAFFDGGRISSYLNGTSDGDVGSRGARVFNTTRSLRLDLSWSNSTIGDNRGIDFVHIERDEPTAVMKGAYWADDDNGRIYRWGGERSFHSPMPEDEVALWGFTPSSNGNDGNWGRQTPWDSDFFDSLNATTHGASAVCGNKGYWVGGYAKEASDPTFAKDMDNILPVPGILEYDFDSRKWRNDSTVPMNSPHGTFINGVAACAQGFAADPMVVVLGGQETEPHRIQLNSAKDFGNITFWNPTARQWHWQKATGDVPEEKGKACAVGAKGDGTYEIVMYGGMNSAGKGTSGDIYILSLPGFQWFKVDGSFPERHNHACTVVGKGKRQMLSTGGIIGDELFDDMDPWPHSIGIFDLTDLVWKSEYDVDAEDYQTPDMIKKWYDDGGMDEVDWSSDAVREMFGDSETSSNDSTDGSDEDSNSGKTGSSTPVGAIAGGVVGGVVGLAILGGIIFFLLRRRRKTNTAELQSTPYDPSTSMHQPLPPKYHEASSPMSGLATSSNGMSELPASSENTAYELDAGGQRMELSGDYSMSSEGRNPGQGHPHGFSSPH